MIAIENAIRIDRTLIEKGLNEPDFTGDVDSGASARTLVLSPLTGSQG